MSDTLFRDWIANSRALIFSERIVAFCYTGAIATCICLLGSWQTGVIHGELRADEPPATANSATPSTTSRASGAVQGSPAGERSARYSPDVVKKAEAILEKAGLKRSGKVIQSTETAPISRALSLLNRTVRELRLVYRDWSQASERVSKIGKELKRLNVQDGEYNLQLARVAESDVSANNRLVGMISATRAKMKALRDEEKLAKESAAKKRVTLNNAESDYAETVLAIRTDYRDLEQRIRESLGKKDVQTALSVMSANFQSAKDWTAEKILATLDKRLLRIEQQIFSESIPMQVAENGSLYVNVVVGSKTARMVVDSGATLVSLPAKTAAELEIKVPVDAPKLSLVLADGRMIPARRVKLSRVRVGQFEAEEVDAAILDASAVGAQPLLGMSYLGNFKFEINTPEKSLKMLRVAAEEM